MRSLIAVAALFLISSALADTDVDPIEPTFAVSKLGLANHYGVTVSVSPVGYLHGRYNLAADYAVTEWFRVGPKVTIFRNDADRGSMFWSSFGPNHGSEAGIRATAALFLKKSGKALTNFFVRPSLYYSDWQGEILPNTESLPGSSSYLLTVQGLVFEGMVGWRYNAPTGFYIDGSIGANLEPTVKESRAGLLLGPYLPYEDRRYSVNPLVEFNVGIEL